MAQTQRESELVAGRYRILRELARGGVGAVYEALDESTGRKVALKRLLANVADKPRLALLFEAEYDTLARLKHPHIVEVFDYGIDKRGPYFTMELLDGQDLSELEPIPYREACRYLRDVASSLALLHTRQRLHRDLSPRNVRITSDGRCRLLDFGTMAGFGESDDIVGTPPLVPPEALRGAALDHRADLYSLGALAYRILSGHYPYRARQLEDLPELWRTPPARLREVAPEAPVELDELVMSMLSLDPTYRPNTAYEVIDRLTTIASLPPDEYQSRTVQGYLVGSRLIGRRAPMATIQRRIARAHRERGGTLVIEGNPGVGKSRLLEEAALHAQLSGALTVRVNARAHPNRYGAISALVRAIVEAAPHDARDAAGPYVAGLSRVSNVFSTGPRRELANAGTRTQIHNAVLNWLFDLADDRTLVILVDDLTRLDDDSTALFNSLSQAIKVHRILLIAARRLADQVAVSASADALVARARCVRLHRFRREETLALLTSLFGPVPNVELLGNWIHDVTTGFPTQIMEIAQHLVLEDTVRFVDGMWVLPPQVPERSLQRNLATTLSGRAAALPPAERALAEALSVRRGHLSLTLCMRLSDNRDTRALFRTLDELVAKGVLTSGANGYSFGQDALREMFLRQLSSKRARRLHRRLGEALLQHESPTHADLIEAGYNLLRGGAELRGADIIAQAAKGLQTRGAATIAALPAVEAALEVYEQWGRPPRDCLRLRTILAGALDRRMTAQYADATLQALCDYAGGRRAGALEPLLNGKLRFVVGFATTQARYWLAPKAERGPRPQVALIAFYRVAFSALSVRTAGLNADGLERVVTLAERLRHAGPLPELISQTFATQLCALRGDIEQARTSASALLSRIAAEPVWLRAASPATISAITATLHIGLGMQEAQYALHSSTATAVVDALKELAQRARALQTTPYADSKDAVDDVELELAAEQLNRVLQLARGERFRADAHDSSAPRTSSVTGMHQQFDVWRTAIDCVLSVRCVDVASLRRTVETFTHYLPEQPWLLCWLEIARAHLLLCLGKPQEAMATYTKWLDVVQPGRGAAWDTLHYGYADALITTGEASQARAFLSQTLRHPLVSRAHDTTARVSLEAQLAWAEAECQDSVAATARISRLERELSSSDHPLILGFVHEVAARVAQRARDEARQVVQLSLMKQQYALTRNQALMARGQRVQDSFAESRPAGAPQERDRDRVVTKVTTRRESNLE